MTFAQLLVVVGVLVAFGWIGFQRGWLRELTTMGVLLLGWLGLTALGGEIVVLANRIWLMLRFTIGGGFDVPNANALLERLRSEPLVDPDQPGLFLALVFLLVLACAYLGAQQLAPRPQTVSAQILGALAGAVNGYVLTYVLVRHAAPDASVSLTFNVSTGAVADTLGEYLSTLLVAGIVLVIGLALFSASRLRQSAGRRSKGS